MVKKDYEGDAFELDNMYILALNDYRSIIFVVNGEQAIFGGENLDNMEVRFLIRTLKKIIQYYEYRYGPKGQ